MATRRHGEHGGKGELLFLPTRSMGMRRTEMPIPSARDINPIPENLDGQYAVRHFLGRTFEEAIELFRERFEVYAGDLIHMGIVAFKYYVPAAIQFANSDAARYDCAIARTLLGVLDHRCLYEREQLSDLSGLFRDYCNSVLDRIAQMDRVFAPDYRLERQMRQFLESLDTD